MSDIFKSADWAREGLAKEGPAKRGPYLIFDPSKLTDEELEVLRNECLRPGGLVFVGENPHDPRWSKADVEFLGGFDIVYGSRPVSFKVLP